MASSEGRPKAAPVKPDVEYWFQYHLLDISKRSIRLFTVLPNLSKHGRIQCNMWHATTKSQYQCLSYRWCPADKSQQCELIEINGAVFAVLPNLWAFLDSFRANLSESRPTEPLWVDAICIDQTSTREKNHQVNQMGQIYKQATEVIIWLGEGTDDQRAVLQMLQSNSLSRLIYPVLNGTRLQNEGWEPQVLLNALVTLFENEYWGRIWIVQEIALAQRRSVMLSKVRIAWSGWYDIYVLADQSSVAEEMFRSNRRLKMRFEQSSAKAVLDDFALLEGRDLELEKLLGKFGNFNCSDPRDRVFALRNICHDSRRIRVDYNVEVEDLFIQIASSWLPQSIQIDRILAKALQITCSRLRNGLIRLSLSDFRITPIVPQGEATCHRLARIICPSCNKILRVLNFSAVDSRPAGTWWKGKSHRKGELCLVCLDWLEMPEHFVFRVNKLDGGGFRSAPIMGVATETGSTSYEAMKRKLLSSLRLSFDGVTHAKLAGDTDAYKYFLDPHLSHLRAEDDMQADFPGMTATDLGWAGPRDTCFTGFQLRPQSRPGSIDLWACRGATKHKDWEWHAFRHTSF